MANRRNTFLIKRSNTPGKIPSAGDLLLGELALNTADVILYASGTTANSILPIGWDRVARTGDTMTGPLYGPSISATTISSLAFSGGNFISSIIPNTNRTLSLGDGTHIWQSTWTQFLRLADSSGNDVVLLSVPTLATSPDPAWEMVLPLQTGNTFNLLGIYSAGTNVSNTAWFGLSGGTNVTLTQSGNISGGTLSISSQDTWTTGGTYSNGTATFTNNTGGTFSVSGFSTGSTDTYVTGVTIANGTLTISQNQGQAALTASTKNTRELTFNSNDMALNTATRATLTPLVMSVTRFDGTGAVDDAGLSFIVPNDYVSGGQFYFTWRAASTGTTTAKVYLDLYTGSTNNLGSLTSSVETLGIVTTPTNTNTFIFSSAATTTMSLSGGNTIHARIYRDPSDGSDTYTGALDMINLNFKYTSIS